MIQKIQADIEYLNKSRYSDTYFLKINPNKLNEVKEDLGADVDDEIHRLTLVVNKQIVTVVIEVNDSIRNYTLMRGEYKEY